MFFILWYGVSARAAVECPIFCRLLNFFVLNLAKGSNPDKNTTCKIFLKNFNVERWLKPPKFLGGPNGLTFNTGISLTTYARSPFKYQKMQNVWFPI